MKKMTVVVPCQNSEDFFGAVTTRLMAQIFH
jgi:hypothetical protein